MSKSSFKKPNLEFYRNKAKKLLKQHGGLDPQSLRLIKYNHPRFGTLSIADIAERKFSLRDAQTVVARVDGYENWTQLRSHVDAINKGKDDRSLNFERAAEAVVHGRVEELNSLLEADPDLVLARSKRSHRSTLLHYVAANGIEQHRQKSPANAVKIAKLLLERGAIADELAETYGGGPAQTTLGLLVSSTWPDQAGVQASLIRTLCEYGANPNGLENNGLPLATALVFFYEKAAIALAQSGAATDNLLAAASVGSPTNVDACFTKTGRLKKGNYVYIGFELRPPKERLEMLGQAFVYAAMCGNLATMKRLSGKHKCPIDAAADRGIRALHLAAYKGHSAVVDWLLKKGADGSIRDDQWHSTAATWAAQTKQTTIRKKIIKSMDLSIHLAVEYSEVPTVKRLLKNDSSLANHRSKQGLVPLHHLHDETEKGEELIQLLVKSGADVEAADPNGRTAIARLEVQGRKDLANVLRKLTRKK